jgi:hypothetical protein
VTLWQVRLQAARGVAFGMVSLVCVFLTLWVAIAAGRHKDYEMLTPVRLVNPVPLHPFIIADTTWVSIGAASVLGSRE